MEYEPFPRSLYRQVDAGPPEYNFEGVQCEMRTVESKEEEADAKAEGWHNSPAEAGAGKAAKASAAPKAEKPKSELALLREQYKALANKGASPRDTADQLREKIAELTNA